MTSTEYSKIFIDRFGKMDLRDRAKVDYEYVKKHGVTTKSVVDLFVWKAACFWFDLNPMVDRTIPDFVDLIKKMMKDKPPADPTINFNNTSVYHSSNKYQYIGLWMVDKDVHPHIVTFQPKVIAEGLLWFVTDNFYMRGLFQSKMGLFELDILNSGSGK